MTLMSLITGDGIPRTARAALSCASTCRRLARAAVAPPAIVSNKVRLFMGFSLVFG